jgi:arylsulfatase A-like enzyme
VSPLSTVARLIILFAIPAMSPASLAQEAGDPERPNVVLIIADYMGYQDTAPYGSKDIRTPSLSRLAREGVRFTNFYSAAPVCGPARAALYSGRYPAHIGFEQNIRTEADGLDASVPTLSRWLVDAGYRTALFGKWHLGYGDRHSPESHGYQEFLGHLHWTISYYSHVNDQGQPGLYDNDGLVEREGYLTDILTEETVNFIERQDERPFFVTLAYNAALPPYQPPGLPETAWNYGWDVNEATREDVVQMVERMDEGIGRVLGAIDAAGKADNTIVIYTHDHGGRHLVDHGPLFHGFANLFEAGIRVPAIIRFPGRIPAGASRDEPAIAMDLTATILQTAGLGNEAQGLDGINLLPVLSGDSAMPARALYWQADHYEFGKQRAIREGRYKFLEHGNTQFLFDVAEDVGERDNLFAEKPEIRNRMRAALDRWQREMPND